MARLVSRLKFKAERMRAAADDPFLTATDLADHLVKQGVPFRQAHAMAGQTVRYCLDRGLALSDLSEDELVRLCPGARAGVKKELTLEASLRARVSLGGTAPRRVKAAVKKALRELNPEQQGRAGK